MGTTALSIPGMRGEKVFFIIAVFLAVFLYAEGAQAIPQTEREALIALYENTDGDGWTNKSGWRSAPLHTDGFALPGSECAWYGITCESESVTQVSLFSNHLVGSIPAAIENLAGIKFLNLSNNQLSGTIPSAIGNLGNLTYLFLNNNQLHGSIPAEIGSLRNLTVLNLYFNQLTGSIPGEIGNLTSLTYLSLGYNQLTGVIPRELGNLPSLLNLYLNDNELSGVIPVEISNLRNLTNLTFGTNQLSGAIPAGIGNLANLKTLRLYNNQLSGTIPPEIGNLTNLKIFSLYSNQLTGDIPSAIASLTGLSSFGIDYNGLFSSDPCVRTFLEAISPGWEATQTVAPCGLTAGPVSETSITLSWTPGSFIEFSGGYRVLVATQPGGPYSLYGEAASKSIDAMVVNGLNPATPYFFVVQTWTDPHVYNQNLVESWFSAELQVATLAPPDSDSDGLSDALENITCTAQNNPDSDGDGIYDGVEDANRNGIQDTGETDPCVADTDEDSLGDGLEVAAGTNPLSKDTDGDGAQDGADIEPLNPLLGALLGSEADLANVFHVAGLGHELGAWKSAAIRRVSFDGAGSFSMTGMMSDSAEGSDLPVSGSGAYVLGINGLGLLSTGPHTLDFAVNRQKDVVVYADVKDGCWQEAGAGVLAGGSGYTSASLNGVYYFADLSRRSDSTAGSLGTITFDGAGGFDTSMVSSETGVGAGITDSYSGVYAMDGDGTLTMQTPHPRTITGGVNADAGIIVAAGVSDMDEQGLWFGVKAGAGGRSEFSLRGTYFMMDYTVNLGEVLSSMSRIVFDGLGSFFMDQTFNHDTTGANQTRSGSGTYSVREDGTFILDIEGATTNGALSEDGNAFITARINDVQAQGISFGIKVEDDQDGDGMDTPLEAGAPNTGDGNGDGTPDSAQDNVVSLPSVVSGNYCTVDAISAGSGAALQNVVALDPADFPADDSYTTPYGLVGFEVVIPANPGFSETVRIYFHGVADLTGYVYRKFDPNTSTWYTLPDVVFGATLIGGQTVAFADLPLTDGGSGDADLLANGVIVGPGGPALPICTLTGDFDADNDVDINDYNTFKQNWGWSGAAGSKHTADFDNDGDVDINDYNTFKQNWGRSCS